MHPSRPQPASRFLALLKYSYLAIRELFGDEVGAGKTGDAAAEDGNLLRVGGGGGGIAVVVASALRRERAGRDVLQCRLKERDMSLEPHCRAWNAGLEAWRRCPCALEKLSLT